MARRSRFLAGVVPVALAVGVLSAPAPAPAQDVIATSTFDSGDEGWKVVTTLGYEGSPSWSATGGNPGGFIYGIDPDTGAWGFGAPDKFLGDVSNAYGRTFSFDIAAYNAPDHDTGWVGIRGGGHEFVHAFAAPATTYPAWHHRSVVMSETAGWFDPNDFEPPTYAEMMAVLSDLDELVITAEFVEGLENDISGLDTVVLVPEPATLSLLGIGAMGAVAGLRRRHRRRL